MGRAGRLKCRGLLTTDPATIHQLQANRCRYRQHCSAIVITLDSILWLQGLRRARLRFVRRLHASMRFQVCKHCNFTRAFPTLCSHSQAVDTDGSWVSQDWDRRSDQLKSHKNRVKRL